MSKRKSLAIDVDGVLAHPGKLIEAFNKVLGQKKTFDDFHNHRMDLVYGVSPDEIAKAHIEIDDFFSFLDLETMKGSKRAVQKLRKDFDILILTARASRYHQATRMWIKQNFGELPIVFATGANIPYHSENFETKIEICRQRKIDFIIEDNPYEIEGFLKTNTIPVCHAWKINESLIKKRVFRGDWDAIEKYLFARI